MIQFHEARTFFKEEDSDQSEHHNRYGSGASKESFDDTVRIFAKENRPLLIEGGHLLGLCFRGWH
jgi:hypothetical protein